MERTPELAPAVAHAPDHDHDGPDSTHASPSGSAPTTVRRIADANPRGFQANKLIDAIVAKNLDDALRMTASAPASAFAAMDVLADHWTNWVAPSTIHTWTAEFLSLIRQHHPISGARAVILRHTFLGAPLVHKRQIFEAQFGVHLTGARHLRGAAESLNEEQLKSLYLQSLLLPAGHVVDNPQFNELHTYKEGPAGSAGTHEALMFMGMAGGTVEVSNKSSGAQLQEIFRHEVGHAVDARLGSVGDNFRHNTAGWHDYNAHEWIATAGGLGSIPANLRPVVERAISSYFGSGSTFKAPTALFEDTLRASIKREGSHLFGMVGETSAADTEKMLAQLRPHYHSNLALRAAIASQGDSNYQRNGSWADDGSRGYFINHYYARGYTIKLATLQHLRSWGDLYAAFSDAEWFAELYQTWYSEPAARASMPEFVRKYFTNVVDKVGATPGNAGSNPAVPR